MKIVISDKFQRPIDYFEDRRTQPGGYAIDADVHSSKYNKRHSGLWRVYFDTLDDAVELMNAFLYLHYVYADQVSNPFKVEDNQLSLNLD